MASTSSGRNTKWENDWLQQNDNPDGQSGQPISKWCRKSNHDGEAHCTICKKIVSYKQHGISALRQHATGSKHSSKVSSATASQQRTVTHFFHQSAIVKGTSQQSDCLNNQALAMAASLRFALVVAKKDLSFSLMDELSAAMPVAFPDSEIAKRFTSGRTKTSYLVNEALAPHAQEQMLQRLRQSPFSILMDEGTKRGRCYLAVLARVFSVDDRKVIIALLGIKELTDCSAEGMKEVLQGLLRDGNVPPENVLAVMTDSCNAMRGQHNGLLAKLKAEIPQLIDVGGCSLHHVHNSVQYAVKSLDSTGEAEDLMDDAYNHFRYEGRRHSFSAVQKSLELAQHAFVRRVETRWLQVLNVVRRVREQWPALLEYFGMPKNSKHERARRIKQALNDKVLARLQFLEQALPRCEKIEKLFQHESTQVHVLSSSLDDLCGDVLRCFIREDVITESASLSELASLAKELCNQRDDESLVIGDQTRETVARMSPNDRIGFFKSVRDFYCELIQRLFSYLPLNNKVLRALRFVNPQYLLAKEFDFDESVLRVATAMKTVVSVDALNELRLEVKKLRISTPLEQAAVAPEEFWSGLSSDTYPILTKLGHSACCIPHGNADSERFLKWLANILTKQRNKLSGCTLESLLTIKTWLKLNSATAFTIPIGPELIDAGLQARSKAAERARKEET